MFRIRYEVKIGNGSVWVGKNIICKKEKRKILKIKLKWKKIFCKFIFIIQIIIIFDIFKI